MSLGAVILNYKTAEESLTCCKQLMRSPLCDEIVIVDNNSGDADDSYLREASQETGFTYKHVSVNRGYSAGNNVGIDYLIKKGFSRVLIANPDVTLRPNDLTQLLDALDNDQSALFAGPKITGVDGTVDRYAQTTHMPNYWETFAGNYPFYKIPLFRSLTDYHISARDEEHDCHVFTVMGCCVLFKADYFATYGLLDEDYFLYNEEVTWAAKPFLATGKLPGLYVAEATAIHDHVKVASQTSAFTVIHRMRSQIIYMRKILHCSNLEKRIAIAYFSAAFKYLSRRNPDYKQYKNLFEKTKHECLSL
jgi:GT2 family glycosyltransferase